MGINLIGLLDVNETSSCSRSRMETINNALHRNDVIHKQGVRYSSKSMMRLFPKNKNLSSTPLSPQRVEHIQKRILEASSYHYHDYSTIPLYTGKIKPSALPRKLHKILSQPNFENAITWLPNGRAFKIKNPEIFMQKVLPAHFRSSNYSSFKRQLNQWGFRRITHNQYYHEMFLRGMPHLCDAMNRISKEDAKKRSKEDKIFVLKQFHKFSNKYPVLKEEKIGSNKKDIATKTITSFKESIKTNPILKDSISKSDFPFSNITKAELTAILAMKELSVIVCAQD